MFKLLAAAALSLCLAACGMWPGKKDDASASAPPLQAAFVLPDPSVVMEANPPPPFTYWAPEGATIRNHPNVPGIWNAFVEGRNVATYFGDQCRASGYQRFVGQPLQSMPQPAEDTELRVSCSDCPVNSDLRANRINVIFDQGTQKITQIACY
jgi:hypothetical protein